VGLGDCFRSQLTVLLCVLHMSCLEVRVALTQSGRIDPLGSPPPALTALWPARSHPAANQGGPLSLAQASQLQPELQRHSSGTPCLRVTALLRAPQYLTGYRTL
jgi:hypothetical protein